jgi:tungstate transport system ATP-binding protein
MNNNKSIINLKNLKFTYPVPGKSSLNDPVLMIDEMEIAKGKVTVFRGHNGSGKTTLLKLLSRLLVPDSGEINSNYQPVMVQQEPYLFHGSVYQNLASSLRFQGKTLKNRSEKISETLNLVGLGGFEKRKARELSGGEKKRAAIARALMTEPEILLLDEPDANVDGETSKELEELICRLSREGMTIILCSHHRGFAYRTSDVIIDLYRGKVVDHHENIFKGNYDYHEGMFSSFLTGGGSVVCPSRIGDFSTAVFSSKDVFVTDKELSEGKVNRLKGTLCSVDSYKEDRLILTLDCGIYIKSQISGTAFQLLNARIGDTLTVVFNPSAVHLF